MQQRREQAADAAWGFMELVFNPGIPAPSEGGEGGAAGGLLVHHTAQEVSCTCRGSGRKWRELKQCRLAQPLLILSVLNTAATVLE